MLIIPSKSGLRTWIDTSQKNNIGNNSLEDMNSTNNTTADYTSAIEKSRSSVVTVESDGS